ncbi:MAG: cytochrome b/b6 domain-containing protein [Methylohalobius sp. ZOD2]
MAGQTDRMVYVWDPLVRILHWVLVVAFFVAYFTEEDFLTTHTWAGYAVGAVVIVRVLWGLIGPKHARFSDFIYSPVAVVRYTWDLLTLRGGRHYLGHTPAGGAMVVVLLVMLAATVWSGMEVLALEEGTGPLARFTGEVSPSSPFANEQALEEAEDFWEELHEFLANFTLALVIVHIGGVLLASFVHRENLVKAMFTGRKRQDE